MAQDRDKFNETLTGNHIVHVAHRTALIPMTLNDPDGHFRFLKSF